MKKEEKNIDITRKEAIKKLGGYAALTAVGTFAILNPLRAQDTSFPVNPGGRTTESPKTQQPLDPNPASSTTTESHVGKTQVKNNF